MRSLATLVVATLLLGACGSNEPSPTATPDRLEGVIVEIDSKSLGDVESFTLKVGSDLHRIFIDPEVDYTFPLGHLQEHVTSASPVAVDTAERDGKLFALTIEDI